MSSPVPLHLVEVDLSARGGVQRAVVRVAVDAPQSLVGQIGELGAVLHPEQLREPEHQVAPIMCSESRAVPETTFPLSPDPWSLIMFSQVTPRLEPKYLRFGRA